MSQSNENILADSIAGIPHLAAFDAMVNARMNAIEVEALLIYVIDSVSASALPLLARQFDVEGFQGYGLATTDEQRRQIIKRAIEFKRYRGTVWAIKEAMQTVGYTGATLIEGVDTGDPDTDWARFKIESELGDTIGVGGVVEAELAKLVREYKPARSYLEGISYTIAIQDLLDAINDTLNILFEAPTLDENLGYFARFYNGAHTYNGAITYRESLDTLTINIQNV